MSSATPEEFDFDAWIAGAERPQHAVTVYQKPGLIADLDVLEVQMQTAAAEEGVDGPSAAGGAGRLRAKYAEIAQQFHDSALTIRVKGHDDAEQAELAKAHKDSSVEEFGHVVLADAILEPKITAAQVAKLEKALGQTQFALITQAYNRASQEIPAVSADFLPESSTADGGGE